MLIIIYYFNKSKIRKLILKSKVIASIRTAPKFPDLILIQV